MLRTHPASAALRLAASLWLLVQAPDALGYFDPASGSLVLQMIIGGIAGVAFVLKLYWHKLLGLFGIETKDPSATDGDADGDEGLDEDEATGDEDDDTSS